MPEDDLDIGFCPRCGDQLDGATPPADLICWRCAADEKDL
jgi:NMD protein affecting ribosome stability and mRNA decay